MYYRYLFVNLRVLLCGICLQGAHGNIPSFQVYCKNCYGKYFGMRGYGHGGFGSVPALSTGITSSSSTSESKFEYHFTEFF